MDFTSLFRQALKDAPSELRGQLKNVFVYAAGRSFYKSVCPPLSVALGWCSYAVLWLEEAPGGNWGALTPYCCTDAALCSRFAEQAERVWRVFLEKRSVELVLGGQLVVVLPGCDAQRESGYNALIDCCWTLLAEMAEAGELNPDFPNLIHMPAYLRTDEELLAPFDKAGVFEPQLSSGGRLKIRHFQTFPLPEKEIPGIAALDEAERAARQVGFFMSTFAASLDSLFLQGGLVQETGMQAEREEKNAHAAATRARFRERLLGRLTEMPLQIDQYVQVLRLERV